MATVDPRVDLEVDLLRAKLKRILQAYHATIKEILKNNMVPFANKMFSANLIGKETVSYHSYDLIMNEFQSGLHYNSIRLIQDHFEKFLNVLESLEGPVKELICQLRLDLSTDNTILSKLLEYLPLATCIIL